MSEYTAAPSALDRLTSAAPVVALVSLIAVAVLPALQQVPYLVPIQAVSPFHVGFGSVASVAGIVFAFAALIAGAMTVEHHPARQLIGAGAALVGGVWLTHIVASQATNGSYLLGQQFGLF